MRHLIPPWHCFTSTGYQTPICETNRSRYNRSDFQLGINKFTFKSLLGKASFTIHSQIYSVTGDKLTYSPRD